jgi:hypothetical protein
MSAIITEKFRQHNATQFYESFSEASANVYYLMIGKSVPFTAATSGGTDVSPATPADDVSTEFYTWDQATALKNIPAADVSYAIPRRDWANSTTYDMYESNISTSNATTSGQQVYTNQPFSLERLTIEYTKLLTTIVELHIPAQNQHLNQHHCLLLAVILLNICTLFLHQIIQSLLQQTLCRYLLTAL